MSDRTRVLHFRIGEEHYCFRITELVKVVELKKLRTVPNSPSFSLGVDRFNGELLEVIDSQKAFDIQGEVRSDKPFVLVLGREYGPSDRYLGMQVDDVYDVHTLVDAETESDVEAETESEEGRDGYELLFDLETDVLPSEEVVVLLDAGELFNNQLEYAEVST